MSGLISGLVFKHYPGTGGELLTALKLADNADDKGRRIFPSIATLATDTRQSERTVQRQLRHMVAMGWLQMVRQARGGGRGGDCGRPREYRIHPDWVQQFDATVPEAARPRWCPIEPAAATPITAQKPPEQQPANAKEMGDKLTPIFSPPPVGKSVDNQYPTKEMGDIAVSEMGDTAVSPYPSLTSSNTEPPNPPMGGERVFQKPEQPPDPPSALTGVATFLALWPPSRRQRAAQVADAIAAIAARRGRGRAARLRRIKQRALNRRRWYCVSTRTPTEDHAEDTEDRQRRITRDPPNQPHPHHLRAARQGPPRRL